MEEAIVGWEDLAKTLGKALGLKSRALQARKATLIEKGIIFPVRYGRWKSKRYCTFPSLIVKYLRYHGMDKPDVYYAGRVGIKGDREYYKKHPRKAEKVLKAMEKRTEDAIMRGPVSDWNTITRKEKRLCNSKKITSSIE